MWYSDQPQLHCVSGTDWSYQNYQIAMWIRLQYCYSIRNMLPYLLAKYAMKIRYFAYDILIKFHH